MIKQQVLIKAQDGTMIGSFYFKLNEYADPIVQAWNAFQSEEIQRWISLELIPNKSERDTKMAPGGF